MALLLEECNWSGTEVSKAHASPLFPTYGPGGIHVLPQPSLHVAMLPTRVIIMD